MRTIEACRSCGSSDLKEVLSLGALHLSAFVDAGVEVPRYPLDLVLCRGCTLVQLRHTVPAEELYRRYWYRSGTNRSMSEELQDIARTATRRLGRKLFVALDIGCNDGTLLKAYDVTVTTVGFEPATNLIPYASASADFVINDFFNAEAWRQVMETTLADVVTSIAMFYDLDDPNAFVRDVAKVIAPDGLWIIQLADLRSMIERTMWDNICHEHLEYYSLGALEALLERWQFTVVDIERNDINGGSIRVFVKPFRTEESERVQQFRQAERVLGLDTDAPYASFAERVRVETDKLVRFVKSARSEGKTVFAYGASTKGNTLLQYAGLDHHDIGAAAERNPDKWGKTTVGTGIPIISEDEARARRPDYFLVLPWHFLREFVEREADYLAAGGAFVVPLPQFRVIRRQDEAILGNH